MTKEKKVDLLRKSGLVFKWTILGASVVICFEELRVFNIGEIVTLAVFGIVISIGMWLFSVAEIEEHEGPEFTKQEDWMSKVLHLCLDKAIRYGLLIVMWVLIVQSHIQGLPEVAQQDLTILDVFITGLLPYFGNICIFFSILNVLLFFILVNNVELTINDEKQDIESYKAKNYFNRLTLFLAMIVAAIFAVPFSGKITDVDIIGWLVVVYITIIQISKTSQLNKYDELKKYENIWQHRFVFVCGIVFCGYYLFKEDELRNLIDGITHKLSSFIMSIVQNAQTTATGITQNIEASATWIVQNIESAALCGLIICVIVTYVMDKKNNRP